jgi:hypothetical protein
MEIWKNIKGFANTYQISNYGNVRSVKYVKHLIKDELKFRKHWIETIEVKHKLLSPALSGSGYLSVGLMKNNVRKSHYVHRLVAETFIKNPNKKLTVNHIDGNKQNNNVDNLEWMTQKENVNHYWNNKN